MMLDYTTAAEPAIRARAALLPGLTIAEIAAGALRPIASLDRVLADRDPSKGFYGEVIEAWFGISNNQRSEPDFVAAGIELKSVPMEVRPRAGVRVKERTYITLIDYEFLARETWAHASVRPKLEFILFVYYWWRPKAPIEEMKVARVEFWRPSTLDLAAFERDWSAVQKKAAAGDADEISAADGLVLAAATKGRNRLTYRTQTGTDVLAGQRGWVLKESFTLAIYEAVAGAQTNEESLAENLNLADPLAFEAAALDHFEPFVGRSVGDVARDLGVAPNASYHYVARVVRRALGLRDPTAGISEFTRYGIEIKTVRVSPAGRPYQHMSFPAFEYMAIIEQDWDDSDLLNDLDRLFIVPVVAPTDQTPYENCVIGRPFFWSPTAADLEVAQREWEMYKREIREGRANQLTPASRTQMIHVRPHTSRAANRIPAPGGEATVKSFWLNRSYVRDLVLASGDDWAGT